MLQLTIDSCEIAWLMQELLFILVQACFTAQLTELLTFPGNLCNKLTNRYLADGQK